MRAKRLFQGEKNSFPSCTDPSQNIELRTIVDRFVRGLPIPTVGHVLTPDDFDDIDNNICPPESLDISEVKDLVDTANDTVLRLQSQSPKVSASEKKPIESDRKGE